eukprot:CAMPEP_0115577164 /NCGR_PEP_ID=MMETSP0272-20121206/2930_1 /TAXON_ID=71861 /ORGANISM="Scrippsiella trochoidea, Strain CCMP3099" /LENGTH=102 /DNA_ID=CAMNT_0003011965 /DNA_START=503 /DNA_END=808 /DNA_ORIENTATION=-
MPSSISVYFLDMLFVSIKITAKPLASVTWTIGFGDTMRVLMSEAMPEDASGPAEACVASIAKFATSMMDCASSSKAVALSVWRPEPATDQVLGLAAAASNNA